MVMSFIFILKKPNDTTIRHVPFDERPSWEVLASKIAEQFSISRKNVSVIFPTNSNGDLAVEKEQDLQSFYKVFPFSGKIKGIVQDLQTPDPPNAITSTWSTGSDLSNADDRLTLFCWVLNVSDNPFSVDIEKSMTVYHLKTMMEKEIEHTFSDVGAHTLGLWKLSSPIPSEEIGTKLRDVESPQKISGCVELDNMDELSKHFSLASRNHLHIIVEVPRLKVQIEAELALIQPEVETFLKNPELPIWDPPEHCTPNIKEFIRGLQIPTYRNGKPSLLFHKLHECHGNLEEITKIFGTYSPVCICNTSGSGKTRRIMEGLTKYWGFYLVAVPDANGVGIRDMREALDLVATYRGWVSDLRGVSPENRAAQNGVNRQIASTVFRRVLAARIVVFEFFLKVATQVDGCLQEKHKRIWLLFQLFDSLSPHGGSLHPFIRIIDKLRPASDDDLDELINRLDGVYDKYLPRSRLILALDEAQRATRLYPYSGITSTKPEVFRSIIRDMVQVFTKAPIKLVVSGTGLSLADLEDHIASGVSKPGHWVEVFHKLGMFDTWPKLKCFVERYVPPSILQSHSWFGLQVRMQEYLLGRYRFSVSFLEYFLMNGLQSPHKLLNEYIERHITCPPGDTGHSFTLGEPDLLSVVEVKDFEWDRLQLDSSAIQEAITIVQSHLTKGQSPTYGPVTAKLVEYGIARLREGNKGHIIEPLAFLSLMMWLKTHSNANLQLDALQAGDAHSRGYAFEEAMVLFLLRKLQYPVPLSTIFDFYPELTPSWANEEAHIVARLDGADVPMDIIGGGAPQNPGLCVVHYAQTIEDIICWIESLDPAPAILIASNLFGPNILLRVKLPSRIVILMGKFKSHTDKDSLGSSTLSHALNSLHPDHWFTDSREDQDQRQKLINTMKKHHVLRFVSGYPSPPDLTSEAKSVKQAISAFDSSDALASIILDELRQHFKSEGEVLNVLKPMEAALSKKRKASEMN